MKDGERGGLWETEKGVDNEGWLELPLKVVHWIPSDILQDTVNKALRCFSITLIWQTGAPAAGSRTKHQEAPLHPVTVRLVLCFYLLILFSYDFMGMNHSPATVMS